MNTNIDKSGGESQGKKSGKPRRLYPRFWEGMALSAWLGLLGKNNFRIDAKKIPAAIVITITSTLNTLLALLQSLLYRKKIQTFKLEHPPIFIVGHWRTGTTLLHQLFTLDDALAYPTTAQCMCPNNFILLEPVLTRYLGFMVPEKRPMDNMKADWGKPQEDEFALCNMGAGSPYLKIAFPNDRVHDSEFFNMEAESAKAVEKWKNCLLNFVKSVAMKNPGKRLVLKSPPHTARIRTLRTLFPQAKFIHITRHPYDIYPSTVNLWRKLYEGNGLQEPNFDGLEEYVLDCMEMMYGNFSQHVAEIADSNFCQLRYEDLVKDPQGELKKLFDCLELVPSDTFFIKLDRRLAEFADYRTNEFSLDQTTKAILDRRWQKYFSDFGYSRSTDPPD